MPLASTHRRTAVLSLLVLLPGCFSPIGEPARVDQLLGTLDFHARAAQLVVVAVTATSADPIDSIAEPIGGVWFEGGDALGLARLSTSLRARPGIPPLVAADLDQLMGDTLADGSPAVWSALRRVGGESPRQFGRLVAEEARAMGLDFALVHGPATVGGAPYANMEQEQLAAGFTAFIEGAERGGLPIALGLFWTPAHEASAARWDRARLEAIEFALLDAARGASALVPGTLALPALTGDTIPLPYSESAYRVFRSELGWDAPILADLRNLSGSAAPERAVEALIAGADLLLVRADPSAVVRAIENAVTEGRVSSQRVSQAARRVLTMKIRAASTAPPPTNHDSLGVQPNPDGPIEISRRLQLALEAPSPMAGGRAYADSAAAGVGSVIHRAEPDQVGMSETVLAAADEAIQQALEDSVMTAAALVVGRRGGLARFRGYAINDSLAHPVDPEETLFDLASLSKVVGTTTATALLVDSGELQLDAPVQRYVPEFRGEHKNDVTIRHLLSHTSGLPPGLWLFGSADSRDQAIEQVLRQPLRRPPGEQVEYSDLGMILLAEVVQRVAGQSLDRFLAARVFAPLDMASTMYLPPVALHPRTVPSAVVPERPFLLRGVVHDGNAYRLGGVTGHAGLFSTARDLAVFSQMLLNRGTYGPARILSGETVDQFTAKQEGADERALGWDTPADRSSAGRFFSASSFGHTGYTGTSIWIDPDRDLFVILLTNRTYTEASPREILDLRIDVHEAAARAIVDQEISRRPGAR